MPNDRERLLSTIVTLWVLPIALLTVGTMGLGLLMTRFLVGYFPLNVEVNAVQALVAARTPAWNTATNLISQLAYIPAIVVVTALAGGAMRLFYRRWRDLFLLTGALVAQVVVYEITSIVIARPRPPVPELDNFRPMRSFPSGHAAAAVALYGGIAVILAMHARKKPHPALVWAVPFTIYVAVAISRVYRGMHYPSDVAASFLVGLACVWILRRAMLSHDEEKGRSES